MPPYIVTIPAGVKPQAFAALCQSRAYRWSTGELHLHAAVDWLQTWAVQNGLVKDIGQDAVQAIMSDAFLPYREDIL